MKFKCLIAEIIKLLTVVYKITNVRGGCIVNSMKESKLVSSYMYVAVTLTGLTLNYMLGRPVCLYNRSQPMMPINKCFSLCELYQVFSLAVLLSRHPDRALEDFRTEFCLDKILTSATQNMHTIH